MKTVLSRRRILSVSRFSSQSKAAVSTACSLTILSILVLTMITRSLRRFLQRSFSSPGRMREVHLKNLGKHSPNLVKLFRVISFFLLLFAYSFFHLLFLSHLALLAYYLYFALPSNPWWVRLIMLYFKICYLRRSRERNERDGCTGSLLHLSITVMFSFIEHYKCLLIWKRRRGRGHGRVKGSSSSIFESPLNLLDG